MNAKVTFLMIKIRFLCGLLLFSFSTFFWFFFEIQRHCDSSDCHGSSQVAQTDLELVVVFLSQPPKFCSHGNVPLGTALGTF